MRQHTPLLLVWPLDEIKQHMRQAVPRRRVLIGLYRQQQNRQQLFPFVDNHIGRNVAHGPRKHPNNLVLVPTHVEDLREAGIIVMDAYAP